MGGAGDSAAAAVEMDGGRGRRLPWVDPADPMGQPVPALLDLFLYTADPPDPMASIFRVGPMARRVDPARSHLDFQATEEKRWGWYAFF